MLREAENKVRIEGVLSETDLKYGSFQKNGKTLETVGGVIKIKVSQNINGEDKVNEIPVHMFSTKYTNAGKPNPAYESIEKVMNEFISIAAAGGEVGADRVRITGAKIQMNEYHAPDGHLISFPRITASFVTKIKKEECKPEATFSAEMVVAKRTFEVDKDGVETGRYKISGIIPQYGGKIDVVDFLASNRSVVDAIEQYWSEQDTVRCTGRLNFTSVTVTHMEEQGFGEAIERTRTRNVNELIITGGSPTPLEGEFAFDIDEINEAIAARKARLEEQKNKDANKTHQRSAPAEQSSKGLNDLGF